MTSFAAPHPSRREVLCGGAAAAAVLAVGGTAAFVGSGDMLRPPGCLGETELLGACLRCDRCRGACPHGVIVAATVEDGLVAMRTPKLDFRRGACDFCGAKEDPLEQPRCVLSCPTGALTKRPWSAEVLGVAEIDTGECIAFHNHGGCTVCRDVCPYNAVSLDEEGRPVVDGAACNGCGLCEYRCPSHSYRDFSGSTARGINVRIVGTGGEGQ